MGKEIELDTIQSTIREISPPPTSQSMQALTPATEIAWETGVWKRFPWLGVGAFTTVIICSIGSVLTLVLSNNKSASQWPHLVPPNVFLSAFMTIANLAIAVAVGQGIAIAWWRRALAGATVKELHHSWSFSAGLSNIVRRYKYFNAIALAAMMAKVAVVDGVLYQKSTTTYVSTSFTPSNESVTAFASTKFPITGVTNAEEGNDGQSSYDFSSVIVGWIQIGDGVNYGDKIQNCNGQQCLYNISGIGFQFTCDNTTQNIDYGSGALAAFQADTNKTRVNEYTNLPLFSVDVNEGWPDQTTNYSRLILTSTYAQPLPNSTSIFNGSCPMELVSTTCELRPAVLEYTAVYLNGSSVEKSKVHKKAPPGYTYDSAYGTGSYTLSGLEAELHEWGYGGYKVLSTTNTTEQRVHGANSTLKGFLHALKGAFASSATITYDGTGWDVQQYGLMAPVEMDVLPPTGYCNYSYLDPSYNIITRTNTLTFMTATWKELYAPVTQQSSTDVSGDYNPTEYNYGALTNQTVNATVIYKEIYYQSNYAYMAGALAATFFCVVCILPSYWGFWELGRDVTLGPFEIANAFQGPAFSGVTGGSGRAADVLQTVGRQRVQYGEIYDESGKKLGFRQS